MRTRFKMKRRLALLMMAITGYCFASDGQLGIKSTSTTTVSVTKSDAVKISDVNSFSFGTSLTKLPKQQVDDVCVYSTTGHYYVTASSVTGTEFDMSSPSKDSIRYTVKWTTDLNSNDGTTLSYNVQSSVFSGADTSSENCSSSHATARLILDIDQTSWDNAPAGHTFTDTLQLVVAPN